MIPGLIDHLWQSTVFAGAAWLLVQVLRKHRAQVRYWVWFVASVKFLVPFSFLNDLGMAVGGLVARGTPVPSTQAKLASVWEGIGHPLAIPAEATARFIVVNYTATQSLIALGFLAVWILGSIVIATCWLVRWRHVRALRGAATPLNFPLIPVPVLSCPGLIEPGVFGILRPVLILPKGISDRLNAAQLEAILAHELCHVYRRDNLTAAIHMAVQVIFWVHPVVWWLGSRLIEERERACDEEVLRLGSKPNVYAESILSVCKAYAESPLVCMSGVSGSNLKKRIEAIMQNRIARVLDRRKKLLLTAAGTTAVIGPILIGALHTPPIRAQVPQPASQPLVGAQSPDVRPPMSFEVATIKPSRASTEGGGLGIPAPNRLVARNQSLEDLVWYAYRGTYFHKGMISSRPAWAKTERFDIEAQSPAPATPDQFKRMLQALLLERFQLKMREETKEIPVYALVLAKRGTTGPKLHPTAAADAHYCAALEASPYDHDREFNSDGTRRCGITFRGGMKSRGRPLADLAQMLSELTDRAVIDRTGLDGRFDFDLEQDLNWDHLVGDAPADMLGPNAAIFDTLQQQLGLKLESTRGPYTLIVIDAAERPGQN